MGKIAERILSSQLKLKFPASHNQFAYTNSIDTTDALVKFSNNITQQLDTTDTLAIQPYYWTAHPECSTTFQQNIDNNFFLQRLQCVM